MFSHGARHWQMIKTSSPRVIDQVQDATNYILRRYREVGKNEEVPLAMVA